MHPVTAAIAAELVVVIGIAMFATVLVNAGAIANFIQNFGW